MISRNSILEEFVENFFIALTALRKGVDHKATAMIHKMPVHPWYNGSPESNYTTLLTPYAVNYVVLQLQRSKAITHNVSEEGKYYIQAEKKMKMETVSSFSCIFYLSMRLPCWHMFALRTRLGQALYEPSTCYKRCTCEYYKATQSLFVQCENNSYTSVTAHSHQTKPAVSEYQKFRIASRCTDELASTMSTKSGLHFDRAAQIIERLSNYWKEGLEVDIVPFSEGA